MNGPEVFRRYNEETRELTILPGTAAILNGFLGRERFAARTVTIDDDVLLIDDEVFRNCDELETVRLPAHLKHIGNWAFCGCGKLKTLELPPELGEIGIRALSGTAVTQIHIPATLGKIGDGALPEHLETVTVDERNPSFTMKDGCLYTADLSELLRCPVTRAGTFRVPDSVRRIADGAFAYCTQLTGITFPDGLTQIGAGAFSHCTGLQTVRIPDGVTDIPWETFSDCTSLGTVTLPQQLSSLAHGTDGAFRNCPLREINVPDGCVGFVRQYGCLYSRDMKQIFICEQTKTGTVRVPEGVTFLGGQTFKDCGGVSEVYLPYSVITFSPEDFAGCALKALYIPGESFAVFTAEEYGLPLVAIGEIPEENRRIAERLRAITHEIVSHQQKP